MASRRGDPGFYWAKIQVTDKWFVVEKKNDGLYYRTGDKDGFGEDCFAEMTMFPFVHLDDEDDL